MFADVGLFWDELVYLLANRLRSLSQKRAVIHVCRNHPQFPSCIVFCVSTRTGTPKLRHRHNQLAASSQIPQALCCRQTVRALQNLQYCRGRSFGHIPTLGYPSQGALTRIVFPIGLLVRKAALTSNVSPDIFKLTASVTATQDVVGSSVLYVPICGSKCSRLKVRLFGCITSPS